MKNIMAILAALLFGLPALQAWSAPSQDETNQKDIKEIKEILMGRCHQKGISAGHCTCTVNQALSKASPDDIKILHSYFVSGRDGKLPPKLASLLDDAYRSCDDEQLPLNVPSQASKIKALSQKSQEAVNQACSLAPDDEKNLCECGMYEAVSKLNPTQLVSLHNLTAGQRDPEFESYFRELSFKGWNACVQRYDGS